METLPPTDWALPLLARWLLRQRKFSSTVTGFIVANTISIGWQADWTVKNYDRSDTPEVFVVADTVFIVFFTVELALRIAAEGHRFLSMKNVNVWWNWLDSIIVSLGLADSAINFFGSSAPKLGVMRMIRILRLVRVIRVIRVARFFNDLRIMVSGIMSSIKSLLWALLLLLMLGFMFGVAILEFVSTELAAMQQHPEAYDDTLSEAQASLLNNWGSLILTVYTLYQSICGGNNWGDVAACLVDITPFLGILFSIYVAVATLCVLNIVTGVFVENAKNMTAKDETNLIMETIESRKQWLEEVKTLWQTFSTDSVLDLQKFTEQVKDVRIQALFHRLGLEIESENVPGLFSLLDFEGTGKVGIDEFAMGIQMLHGQAKSIDMARLRFNLQVVKNQLADLTEMFRCLFPGYDEGMHGLASSVSKYAHKDDEFEKVSPLQSEDASAAIGPAAHLRHYAIGHEQKELSDTDVAA